MADQVNPVEGQAQPAQARPAPIPRRQTRFRPSAQPGHNVPGPAIPAFPVSQGLSPMVSYLDGYASVEVPMSGLNTVIPSYVNAQSRVFLTNQRLSANDKFLKETNLYHPDALDLYIAFCFMYHILNVRSSVGGLSAQEDTLLSNLKQNYAMNSLPIPGTLVDCFMSITANENPYSWLGNTTPELPANNQYRSAVQGYNIANNFHMILPNIAMLVSQITALTRINGQVTEQNVTDLNSRIYNLAGAQMSTNDNERFWLTTPRARFPGVLNLRVAQAFKNAVFGQIAAPFLSKFALDLPNLAANNVAANMDLASYLGVIDAPGINPRRMQYLRWPSQLAGMVAIACKYISGSRHLSDLPTTGLGSLSPTSVLTPGIIFEDRDPAVIQPGAAAAITPANTALYHVVSLNATLEIRDPVISDLAVQIAMISQSNMDIQHCVDNAGAQIAAVPVSQFGPFWTYPQCETGPEAAVANLLISHLPNFVRSNPRRDAAE
jgi:hypothetical protein